MLMETQIDMLTLANIVETLDCSPEYEEDAFAFSVNDVRCYCERRRHHFNIYVGELRLQMPR